MYRKKFAFEPFNPGDTFTLPISTLAPKELYARLKLFRSYTQSSKGETL